MATDLQKIIKIIITTSTAMSIIPLINNRVNAQVEPIYKIFTGEGSIERNASEKAQYIVHLSGNSPTSFQTAGEQVEEKRKDKSPESNKIDSDINSEQTQEQTETIVVTGSHIRGAIAAGANVQSFSREELDQSGYATVQDFIQTLPQNFQGGGVSEDPSTGTLNASNQMGGSAINLRGLGADSTLILINGRRGPQSGLAGNFTDVSLIPQTAIERVEVLLDGASALYGSDAIGGVVNFVLRKDFEGAETRIRYGRTTKGAMDEIRLAQAFGSTWDGGHVLLSYEYYDRDPLFYKDREYAETFNLRPRGGADNRLTTSNPGNILNPVTSQPAYAIPRNQNGNALQVSELLEGETNFRDRNINTNLLPKQKLHSAYLNTEQRINGSVVIFAELIFSERKTRRKNESFTTTVIVPETNPFLVDPFGFDYSIVSFSFEPEIPNNIFKSTIRNRGVSGGANIDIEDWRWDISGSFGQEKSHQNFDQLNFLALNQALADPNPRTSLNVFGDGRVNNPQTIEKLLSASRRSANSRIYIVRSVFDGPVSIADAVPISAAVGTDYRRELFRSKYDISQTPRRKENFSRSIYSAYAELFAKIIEPHQNVPILHDAEISIAGRIDKYSDVGTTSNPSFGAAFRPHSAITIKANYGTSFRAPNMTERSLVNNSVTISNFPDPKSPTGNAEVLLLDGNHPDLQSEKATTWSLGAHVRPEFASGFTLGARYFEIKFKDRINHPTDTLTMLSQDDLYPDLVIRNPSTEQLLSYCNSEFFSSDPALCTPDFVKVILDIRNQNMAKQTVRGIDSTLTFASQIGAAELSLGLTGTYIIDYAFQQTSAARNIDTVDTLSNPIDLRIRAYAGITIKGLNGTVFINYSDSYANDRSKLAPKIDSYTTIDFTLNMSLSDKMRPDPDGPINVQLSIINLLANNPPFADNILGYDANNADPLGRLVSLELRARW